MNSHLLERDIYDETVPDDLISLRQFYESGLAQYRFIYYDRIDSTNDTAKSADYPDHTVITANAQDKGRGRYARDWYSPHGVNIYMTVVLKPAAPAAAISLLNIEASLAVCRALRAETALDVWPRWPNDIYIGDKKAGGILSESVISGGNALKLIIGIGINVNAAGFPPELKDKATSLTLETGMKYDRGRIIASILTEFDVCRTCLPSRVISEWTAMSRTIGSYVYLAGRGGRARSLNEDGSLVLALDTGQTVAVASGDSMYAPCS